MVGAGIGQTEDGSDPDPAAWCRDGGDDVEVDVDGDTVRPFFLTRGRTRSVGEDLPVEALVTAYGRPTDELDPEHRAIVELCRHKPIAIAEIAARGNLPLGVARVVVSDLVAWGHMEVHETVDVHGDAHLLRRLIAGVRAI
jgi:hypothetical protein